jgi:PTH1 family peptidyl-tRNA hydrolase
MILIVGLGNPGKKFEKTRHNAGFRTIDEIAAKFQFPIFIFQKKSNSLISKKEINQKKVVLVKPQTFINNSGKAVKVLIKHYNLNPENLFVIHDDLDLPLGKIRIAKNRGSAGHKGVQSIINELGTKDFIRFRIGIKPQKIENRKQKIEELVLQKFTRAEEKIVKEVVKKTIQVVDFLLKEGLEKTMSKYNG